MTRPPRVAVVGAGVAGAGVATAIADSAVDVTVLERGDTVGGRTATRRRDGCRYDTGANYLSDGSERVSDLVRTLDDGDLVDIERSVWTFGADGDVSPGDDERADDHRWTFEGGLETLPRRLLERSSATVRTATAVTGLTYDADADADTDEDRWTLDVEDDEAPNAGDVNRRIAADAVVLTPPGPATASILEASTVDGSAESSWQFSSLAAAARSVSYRSIHSFALHYPFDLERPYYALVNTDREHPVGWVAREGEKRGHVPDGETLLIAQMAPDWSVDYRSTPAADAANEAAERVAALLEDERLADPDWTDRIVWRDALPTGDTDTDTDTDGETTRTDRLRDAEPDGLFVASDCTHGRGRIHAALESGLSVGDRLLGVLEG
ncbi:FAD-dependent oxidoreductase [Halobacteria archaeon AArc-m2/3/4]|uniref:FAD-dependent oxidoreductase n=1 Tax=Natronoglomus mannanivorans TaxID=2979990 RepID=A0ABT2QD86_9EURY|nr:FAD-dependent oxidoreductase [Halobacteria archaeon AArc-m2/3/4]